MKMTNKFSTRLIMMFKALIISYAVNAVLLLITAFLLFKFELNEDKIRIAIILIYIVSGFVGGLIIGKKTENKKYLWGLLEGITYFVILFMISLLVNKEIDSSVREIITTFLVCSLSGMAGGMIS